MRHELTSKDLTWINVQSPEANELAEFIRESGLTVHDAEFVAQQYHRPGVTVRPNYVLVLISVPVFDRKLRLTYGVSLFFVIKEHKLYSLHYDPLILLDKIRRDFETSNEWREESFEQGTTSLLLDLLQVIYEGAFRKLERLNKHIDIAEDAVFQGNEKKMVEEISLLTRDVMDFRRVIRPQRTLFRLPPQHQLVPSGTAIEWTRIDGQLMKMWEVTESMFESVRELSNTNFTMLQHKENELLRLLTIYSIIVIPMLVITDPLFNPAGPDASIVDKTAFWMVLGVLVVTLIFILMRFRGRR